MAAFEIHNEDGRQDMLLIGPEGLIESGLNLKRIDLEQMSHTGCIAEVGSSALAAEVDLVPDPDAQRFIK